MLRLDPRPPPLSKAVDHIYGFSKKDGRLWMGNKAVRLDPERKNLTVDDSVYKLTPALDDTCVSVEDLRPMGL